MPKDIWIVIHKKPQDNFSEQRIHAFPQDQQKPASHLNTKLKKKPHNPGKNNLASWCLLDGKEIPSLCNNVFCLFSSKNTTLISTTEQGFEKINLSTK